MAQSTRRAIQLNNTGAERFAVGDIQGALEAFRHALSLVSAHEAATRNNPIVAIGEAVPLGISFADSSQIPTHNDEEKPFVYERPLVFSRVLPESRDGAAAFCGVIVFNMALVFDLRSDKKDSSSGRAYKTKALQLYEASIDLFSKTTPGTRADLTSVMAAACNNKARICFEYSKYAESHRELLRLQTLVTIADRSPTKGDFLVEADVQGMLLNLLLLWPPIVAQAA